MAKRELIFAGIVLTTIFGYFLHLGNLQNSIFVFLGLFVTAFFVYGLSYYAIKDKQKLGRKILIVIVAFAIVFRVIMLFTTPTLSDDIYRYIWDGKMQLEGINPFEYAPSDPALQELRNEHWPLINHKDVPTIYPPVAQWFFTLFSFISPTVLFFKLMFVLFELGCGFLVYKIIKLKNLEQNSILLYLWNPLLIVEVAGSGHYEPIGIFFMLLAVYFYFVRKQVWSIVTLSLSALTKFFSGALFPFLFLKLRSKKMILLAPLIAILAYLPYLNATHLTTGLRNYSARWEFNGLVYDSVKWLFELFVYDGALYARLLLLVVFIGIALYLFLKNNDLITSSLLVLLSYFLLTHTFYPWYALWLLAFAVLKKNWSVLYLTFGVGLTYIVFHTGVWQVPWWIYLVEFGGFLVVWWVCDKNTKNDNSQVVK